MDVERIKFERTGGFAGMTIARDLKPDDLSEEQVHRLSELLDDLEFETLPEQMTGSDSMPDEFTYTITVETRRGEYTVVTGDASAPEKMQELLQFLNRLARKKKNH